MCEFQPSINTLWGPNHGIDYKFFLVKLLLSVDIFFSNSRCFLVTLINISAGGYLSTAPKGCYTLLSAVLAITVGTEYAALRYLAYPLCNQSLHHLNVRRNGLL
jgi:hypothetical protein